MLLPLLYFTIIKNKNTSPNWASCLMVNIEKPYQLYNFVILRDGKIKTNPVEH